MALTISEVLALEPFVRAEPEVLTGAGCLDRQVRWVHSSEIYEMGPLLSGGELLLTTGLGLAGADAGARRHYIREIAERNIAALGLEVGRTFPTVPPELVDESRKRSLPLIVFNRVVPFIQMSEAANTAIIDNNSRRLALMAGLSFDLDRAIIAGDGIRSLLAIAARRLGGPLALVAENGILVSAQGVSDEHAARQLAAEPDAVVALEVRGQPWGRLCAGPARAVESEDVDAVLGRLAVAVTLSLIGTGLPPDDPERQAAALLEDLLADGNIASTDFTVRAGLAGFHPPAAASLLALAVETEQAAPALALIDETATTLRAYALRARVRGEVLGILAVCSNADPITPILRAMSDSHQVRSGEVSRVIVAPPTRADGAPAQIAQSLTDVRDALALARSIPACFRQTSPVITVASMTLELHLSRLFDSDALDRIITQLVGPVLDWDQRHKTNLLSTLEVHLRHGCSPTRTAEALYLGRHSVYQRLQRIESLLGTPVSDPHLHAGLLLAACAARLRTRPPYSAEAVDNR